MSKHLSLVTIALLLVTMMISPGLANGYTNSALHYLIDKYDIDADQIELYEGGIMNLEFTGESFWYGRYIIMSEGMKAPSDSGGGQSERQPMPAPMPDPEPAPAPDKPDEPITTNVLPSTVAPDIRDEGPVYNDGYIYGGIYIHLKTGEILDDNQMQPYFSAEHSLAEQEWNRLREEAGKLDMYLYRKLENASPSEKVAVWIVPKAIDNDEIRAQLANLKEKHPEWAQQIELSDILYNNYGHTLPAAHGDIIMDSEPVVDQTSPAAHDEPVHSEAKPDISKDPAMPADRDWKAYEAMWQELENIRLQAMAPSIENIAHYLDNIGADYQVTQWGVTADLTAAQIHDLVDQTFVATIYEDAVHSTMDIALAPPVADSTVAYARTEAGGEATGQASSNDSTFSIFAPIAIGVLLTGALLLYVRRTITTK